MFEFLTTAKDWIWGYHRVLAACVTGVVAGGGAAYLVAEVLGRLDRGGREPVGRLITYLVALVVVTVAAATIASMPFASSRETSAVTPSPAAPGASVRSRIAKELHPADYAYLSASFIFAVGGGLWAVQRRRRRGEGSDDPETSLLLLGAGSLLLITLWIFQRGVEQLKPATSNPREFFGTIAGAGVLAMAIIQGLRALLPLRGVFHRVTLERWIADATSDPSPSVEQRRRIVHSVTRLARGPVSADKYALLDLPIEQLCGQIAAGADRLLDAPFAATLETTGSRAEPVTVKEVLLGLAAGGDKDIDDYLRLAGKMVPATNATGEPDDSEPKSGDAETAVPKSAPPNPTPDSARDYLRLRTSISQRIQRNIDGLQISTTFWWRRVVRSLAFILCGVLGLSVFHGLITETVMCAIVGGFVATASRDLIAVIEKGAPLMQWDRQSLRYRNGVIDEPGGGRPHGSGRIVLLVHGYNNDKADADLSYAALLANVTADVGAVAENIWRFYWPSYVSG